MESRLVERYTDPYFAESAILPQTIGRSLLMQPASSPPAEDRSYYSSEAFWRDILNERLVAERVVFLRNMRLFEWFPRNPGLFHTDIAGHARAGAMNHVRTIDQRLYTKFYENSDAPPDHASLIRSVTEVEGPPRTIIFDPYGKLSMLEGGIGCVRLLPAEVEGLGRAWFMSISSSTSPDEGIPLLVPDNLYQACIDRIRQNGFATLSVVGRTKFIPERFLDLYAVRFGIPRMYVEVESIDDSGPDEDNGLVSVAASFIADIEDRPAIYAAYVTFDPGHVGARTQAARWLRDEYVRGFYNGEILTDFDQQAPMISNTLFSLNDVLTSTDLAAIVSNLRRLHGRFDWGMLEHRAISFTENKEFVRMKIEANNNSGNQAFGGDNANVQLVVGQSDLGRLSADLSRLIEELRQSPPSNERDRMVGTLLEAGDAASAGDTDATLSALKRLKPFASKILDIAEKVGVGVAVAVIKKATGL